MTRSGSVSEASEDDILDSLDAGEGDSESLDQRLSDPTHNADRSLSLDPDHSDNVFLKSSAATLPSHVKLVVNELESRYSTRVCPPTHTTPTLQSCAKISALQDTLISRVQDSGTSKLSPPELDKCPKVTAVREGLIAKVQVPETSRVSTPMLQSCPKITALRETLISRVQDPGSSHRTFERDLADCPSVASRQTALLGAARQPPTEKRSTVATSSLPRNVASNYSDELQDGLLNSTDGPKESEGTDLNVPLDA